MPGWKDLSGGKKTAVILAGGGLGVGALLIYRKRAQAAQANAAANTSGTMVTDPAGNQCTAVDPASGYCPGTPEDSQYQTGAGLGDLGSTMGAIDPNTGIPYADELGGLGGSGAGGTVGGGTTAASFTPPTSNAQWAQQAITYLEGLGYNPETVAAALGQYVAHLPLTQAQLSIVDQALAVMGQPPIAIPPPVVSGGGGSGQGGGGGNTTGNTTVPHTVGQRAEAAIEAVESAGLNARTSPERNPKNTYEVTSSSPAAGKSVKRGSTVTLRVKVLRRGK